MVNILLLLLFSHGYGSPSINDQSGECPLINKIQDFERISVTGIAGKRQVVPVATINLTLPNGRTLRAVVAVGPSGVLGMDILKSLTMKVPLGT